MKFLVGIDEAGRGPLAGPVAVAAFCIPHTLRHQVSDIFPDGIVRDSKKLTPEARERIFRMLADARRRGSIAYTVSFSSARVIDRRGIVHAITRALTRAIDSLGVAPDECRILLDGGLKAPPEFLSQKTIIKGDEREAVIALASVVAKVSRDRRMRALAKRYPAYGFDLHKGYGTRAHYQKLRTHGLSPVHRRSFLKTLVG